jgi:hypothetical protein
MGVQDVSYEVQGITQITTNADKSILKWVDSWIKTIGKGLRIRQYSLEP